MADTWKCPNCGGTAVPVHNYCPKCNHSVRPNRLSGTDTHPKVTDPPSMICYAARANQTLVLAQTDLRAERLYVVGVGDILPIEGEDGDFYQVLLPGSEKGFVHKSTGMKVEVGLGEVKDPLGYARRLQEAFVPTVAVLQPDGKWETIHTIKSEDRLPIVAEEEHSFMVQLPSGVRGWVQKAKVIRTISPDSLPAQGSLASALGFAALLGIAAIGGGLMGDPDEARIRRGVAQALRDRGL